MLIEILKVVKETQYWNLGSNEKKWKEVKSYFTVHYKGNGSWTARRRNIKRFAPGKKEKSAGIDKRV